MVSPSLPATLTATREARQGSISADCRPTKPFSMPVSSPPGTGRGDAGVGSDLDLLLILKECSEPIWDPLRRWDTGSLPLVVALTQDTRWRS